MGRKRKYCNCGSFYRFEMNGFEKNVILCRDCKRIVKIVKKRQVTKGRLEGFFSLQ